MSCKYKEERNPCPHPIEKTGWLFMSYYHILNHFLLLPPPLFFVGCIETFWAALKSVYFTKLTFSDCSFFLYMMPCRI